MCSTSLEFSTGKIIFTGKCPYDSFSRGVGALILKGLTHDITHDFIEMLINDDTAVFRQSCKENITYPY